jgi:hypothetical protein
VLPGSPTLKPSAFQLLRRGLQARDLRGNAAYVLGRFYGVRRVYAAALRTQAQLRPAADSGLLSYPGPSLFGALQPERLASELRERSVCFGLQLPAETVRELVTYARSAECQPRLGGAHFRYDDVVQGVLPTGEPAVIGDVLGAEHLPQLERIGRDPLLLAVARRYMGYTPRRFDRWLHWSFVSACSDAYRREQGQTVDYHFDVHGYNFLYVSFYLTAADARTGAHVYVEDSHRKKPVRWLFDTARRSDAEIAAHYGQARQHVISAPAGAGFIEDTACYHKALAPLDRDRLLLQLRYL